ncbi:hypothetical protein GCM10009835_52020 [Planosporangium flavigriseum]|uniref:Uncharacterized protein n=1 Tax=Planosporangium flavigriseum TaxID=373681 RepID=A0A8J3M062_9ACTN|nr:hypothetical protein Pfl04_50340 [Planosporangium flavigriseum]
MTATCQVFDTDARRRPLVGVAFAVLHCISGQDWSNSPATVRLDDALTQITTDGMLLRSLPNPAHRRGGPHCHETDRPVQGPQTREAAKYSPIAPAAPAESADAAIADVGGQR